MAHLGACLQWAAAWQRLLAPNIPTSDSMEVQGPTPRMRVHAVERRGDAQAVTQPGAAQTVGRRIDTATLGAHCLQLPRREARRGVGGQRRAVNPAHASPGSAAQTHPARSDRRIAPRLACLDHLAAVRCRLQQHVELLG